MLIISQLQKKKKDIKLNRKREEAVGKKEKRASSLPLSEQLPESVKNIEGGIIINWFNVLAFGVKQIWVQNHYLTVTFNITLDKCSISVNLLHSSVRIIKSHLQNCYKH